MNREQMIDLAAKVLAEVEPDTEWTPFDEREYLHAASPGGP
jgi:hypothetical protein